MSTVAGTWKLTLASMMGAQEATVVLDVDGTTVTGRASTDAASIQLHPGTVDGNAVTLPIELTSPMRISVVANLTVDGDTLSGKVSGTPVPVRVTGVRVD